MYAERENSADAARSNKKDDYFQGPENAPKRKRLSRRDRKRRSHRRRSQHRANSAAGRESEERRAQEEAQGAAGTTEAEGAEKTEGTEGVEGKGWKGGEIAPQTLPSNLAATFEKSTRINVSDVTISENAKLEEEGKRGVAIKGQSIEVAVGSLDDSELIFHELAHIGQQRGGSKSQDSSNEKTPDVEEEAVQCAQAVEKGVDFTIANTAAPDFCFQEASAPASLTETKDVLAEPDQETSGGDIRPKFLTEEEYSAIKEAQEKEDFDMVLKILAAKAKLRKKVELRVVQKDQIAEGDAVVTLGEKSRAWLNSEYEEIKAKENGLTDQELVLLLIDLVKTKEYVPRVQISSKNIPVKVDYAKDGMPTSASSARIHVAKEVLTSMSSIASTFNVMLHEKVHVNDLLKHPSLAVPFKVGLPHEQWLQGTYGSVDIRAMVGSAIKIVSERNSAISEVNAFINQLHDPNAPLADLSLEEALHPLMGLDEHWNGIKFPLELKEHFEVHLRAGFGVYIDGYFRVIRRSFDNIEEEASRIRQKISKETCVDFVGQILERINTPQGELGKFHKKDIIHAIESNDEFKETIIEQCKSGDLAEIWAIAPHLDEINNAALADYMFKTMVRKIDHKSREQMEKYLDRTDCERRWTRWKKMSDMLLFGQSSAEHIEASKLMRGYGSNLNAGSNAVNPFGIEPQEFHFAVGSPGELTKIDPFFNDEMNTRVGDYIDTIVDAIKKECAEDACDDGKFNVCIYATRSGTDKHNAELNEKRIESIRQFLKEKKVDLTINFTDGRYWDQQRPGGTIHFVPKANKCKVYK